MRIGLDYPELLHGDLIGSTGWLTDAAGQATERLTYTAFGEPVTQDGVGYPPAASDTRYGYGGAWGYETGLLDLAGADANLPPVRLLHVGHRWYQPDVGRFVQRDPIGIAGGLNVYLYCGANPLGRVDPDGLWALAGALKEIALWPYNHYLNQAPKVEQSGTRQMLKIVCRQHIQSNNTPYNKPTRVDANSSVDSAFYIRREDGRISIIYSKDGVADQFYTPDDAPPLRR
jgi:RHS repeat-associated protein